MTSYHINPKTGAPGVCKASLSCPFGQELSSHHQTADEARLSFERLMVGAKKLPADLERLRASVYGDQFDLVIMVNESGAELNFLGHNFPHLDAVAEHNGEPSVSLQVAEFMERFTEGLTLEEDGFEQASVVTCQPIGERLKERAAVLHKSGGVDWVIDYSYSEVNPNREWPYVNTVENWRLDLEKESFLEREAPEPEPVDPRSLSLPTVKPGEHNPLLKRATLEEDQDRWAKVATRFLSVDQVRVAAIQYKEHPYGLQLHSIQTRPEYQRQGYMKRALELLQQDNPGKDIFSSSSYTPAGYHTRHLTKHRPGHTPTINYPEKVGDKSFSFIHDWITGAAKR